MSITWFPISDKAIAKCKLIGLTKIPTELAIRVTTGQDQERALKACSGGAHYRGLLISSSLCGVSYDPARAPESRKKVETGGGPEGDPALIPENLYGALPSRILTIVDRMYGEINDGDTDDVKASLEGRQLIL